MKCQARHIGFKEIPEATIKFRVEVKGERKISALVCNDCRTKMKGIIRKHIHRTTTNIRVLETNA